MATTATKITANWTKITATSGTVIHNSSNVSIEVFVQDTDTAPNETDIGVILPSYADFKIPSTGYVFARCSNGEVSLVTNAFAL